MGGGIAAGGDMCVRSNGVPGLLSADAIGALACRAGWLGGVHSVFPRALNILRGDGLVVSLVAAEEAMTGMGILVPAFFEACPVDGPAATALEDRDAVFDGTRLHIPSFAVIECAGGRGWEGTVAPMRNAASCQTKLRTVEESLLRHGRPGGLIGVIGEAPASEPIVVEAREALMTARFGALVGLGPGLTPAGDDFLAGMLLAGRTGSLPRSSLSPAFRAEVEAALPGTTPGGRTLLWLALQGRFPAYLLRFLGVLAAPANDNAIQDAVRDACAHGETSGTDCLSGFCWMLRQFHLHSSIL